MPLSSTLIAGYAGTDTIRKSPLVVNNLGDSTEPRAGTIFLESDSNSSFTQCPAAKQGEGANIYTDTYLRWIFDALKNKTGYNITLLNEVELVVPVVDCTFAVISGGGAAIARVNYLVRFKNETDRMLILPASISIQDYYISDQYESGSTLLLTFSVIETTTAESVSHYYALALDYPYEYTPDFELGFYLDKETSQVNQINLHWDLADDAMSALTYWTWHGDSVIRDNWAWVHIIHLFFAVDVLFQLCLLLFLVYRSVMQNRFWIGDAFASISNTLLYRGIYVIISNHINGYWTFTEFSLALADSIGGNSIVIYRPEMAHADMLTIYLNLVSVLSYVLRERVDPIFAMVCFEVGFNNRESLAQVIPSLQKKLVEYSNVESTYGRVEVSDFLAKLSPMRLWTVHPVHQKSQSQVGSQDKDNNSVSRSSSSGIFRKDSEPRELMQFETATGSVLKNRFGIISTYNNYSIVSGQRFTSGDAIYCNGFVVANDKFVIATEDLMSLIAMKITRARFVNIYVYTLKNGTDVNQTARLVYPQTISWHDLAKLGVSHLG
ncbi:hypothetical protein BBO99_00008456 [Phytophthora kernoviae]|uniref:Uncharacterized protein n=2 Tax=Phytophthora kernoviae TaxID=325452 RepID=A0A3R7MST6_9STRA|nr:hypothetical protein G195_009795 [Phytophthora kernoviae 00238/432]KAG2511630.1 hypothetical protein JM16_008204 [Phytophthora kernoviae]KAG2514565.1 hypothetical protein JM18_008316 [Phytophthora kernoviae]RLN32089.1 hypothetical protein BBI17_008399 [Phytophthora kernoviae]RLN75276.1 hypothetical protein BBO99_00008456 [Phytophthora kernoviae]